MDAYAMPALVEYPQLAFSSVVKLKVACVVPAGNVPDGDPFERTGGVVSLDEPEKMMRRSVPPVESTKNKSPPGPAFKSIGLGAPVIKTVRSAGSGRSPSP